MDANDYFVQARLSRESAREEALDIVKDMMNDVKATDEVKKQAAEKAAAIAQAVEQESKIESLIKSKGFADCVVYIEGENCSIVVRSEGLKPQESGADHRDCHHPVEHCRPKYQHRNGKIRKNGCPPGTLWYNIWDSIQNRAMV